MFFTCGQEAIAQKLSDTRSLLGTARRLRATVADAEFAAWTARQRAGDVGPSVEERAVWKEALARIRGVPPEAQAGWMRRWWWRNFDDDALCFPCVEVEVRKHASCWRCWVGCNGWWHLGSGSWFKDIFQDQWERGDGFARKTDSRLYTLNYIRCYAVMHHLPKSRKVCLLGWHVLHYYSRVNWRLQWTFHKIPICVLKYILNIY